MTTVFWLTIGMILGSTLLIYARTYEVRGEKVVLANALVVAAIVYVAFALIWGNTIWVLIEVAGVSVYSTFVWAAKRYSPYWLSIGWLLHPIWDVSLHILSPGKEVAPEWYVNACISFDILIAAYVFVRTANWQQESIRKNNSLNRIGAKGAPPG